LQCINKKNKAFRTLENQARSLLKAVVFQNYHQLSSKLEIMRLVKIITNSQKIPILKVISN